MMQNSKNNYQESAKLISDIWLKGYSIVPNLILERKDLGAIAKVCASWLIGRPSGWHLIISQMCGALDISEKQWATAKKELIAAGLFKQEKLKKSDGKIEWYHWWFTIPTFTKDGSAANDETMNGEPQDLELIAKKKDKALLSSNMQDGDSHYLSVAARECGIFNIPNTMARKWENASIKIEQVKEACGKAKQRKGNEPIPANYLDKIVMDYANKGNQHVIKTKEILTGKAANDTYPKTEQPVLADAMTEVPTKLIAENSPIYNPEETLAQIRNLGIKKTISLPQG